MNLIEKAKAAIALSKLVDRLGEERKMGHLKAGIFGLASAVVVAVAAQVSATCPDLFSRWPELLMAGVLAGVGVYLRRPQDAPKA